MTDSLSKLDHWQLQELERRLQKMIPSQVNYVVAEGDQERDKMRKAVISAFRSIGRTAADAKAWAEKYGVNGVKKKFNEYTKAELFLLIRNANKVKTDFAKSSNNM